MAKDQMNTSGPSGGKGSRNQASLGRTVRATGYGLTGGKNRGDTTKISARTTTSTPNVPKQAAVNRGPMTQQNTGMQKMGRTSPPHPASNKNSGQPRAMQNSMTGKGSPKG